MDLPPQKFRELVFQCLYGLDISKEIATDDFLRMITEENKVAKKYAIEAFSRAELVLSHIDSCDALITSAVVDYTIDRIHTVERTILRLATYEIAIEKKIPKEIILAEATRLVKKFSTQDAVPFVQGILLAIAGK